MSNALKIAILPGDHIGPEITAAAVEVLKAVDEKHRLGLVYEECSVGHKSLKANGTTLTEEVFQTAKAANGGFLLGPCDNGGYPDPSEGGINVPGRFRHDLDLFANLRPSRTIAGIPNAREGLDILVVRENTEGFYPDRNMFRGYGEIMPTPDVAISMRRITRHASERAAREAFEWARRRRKKVTVVTKKHILRMTDGLFHEACFRVAEEFPDVECNSAIIDSFAADLYLTPQMFDVAVMTNMIGDVMSNLCSALAGGLGLGGGLNASTAHAMANASHGSAPDIASQNKANPVSMIVSAAMLLEWLGSRDDRSELIAASQDIVKAVDGVLADPSTRTVDVGGTASTTECTKAVIALISD